MAVELRTTRICGRPISSSRASTTLGYWTPDSPSVAPAGTRHPSVQEGTVVKTAVVAAIFGVLHQRRQTKGGKNDIYLAAAYLPVKGATLLEFSPPERVPMRGIPAIALRDDMQFYQFSVEHFLSGGTAQILEPQISCCSRVGVVTGVAMCLVPLQRMNRDSADSCPPSHLMDISSDTDRSSQIRTTQ